MVMMRSEGTHLLYTCIIDIILNINIIIIVISPAHLDKSLNSRSTLITLFSTDKDSIRTFQVLCIWGRSLQIINHWHYHYRSRRSKSSAFLTVIANMALIVIVIINIMVVHRTIREGVKKWINFRTMS